jgi:hypothetical protein
MRINMRLVLILVAVIAFYLLQGARQGQTQSSPTFEYKIMWDRNPENDKKLGELGAQGWELVAIRPTTDVSKNIAGAYYYFKRAK